MNVNVILRNITTTNSDIDISILITEETDLYQRGRKCLRLFRLGQGVWLVCLRIRVRGRIGIRVGVERGHGGLYRPCRLLRACKPWHM